VDIEPILYATMDRIWWMDTWQNFDSIC